jgi:hypothetical protein
MVAQQATNGVKMKLLLLKELRLYIASNLESAQRFNEKILVNFSLEEEQPSCSNHALQSIDYPSFGLEDFLTANINKETFPECLLNLIDKKGLTDVEAYQKAMIDRRLFSKIRNNPDYHPAKKTVFAFIIALGLGLEEAEHLLSLAGYAFSKADICDLIIIFFINKGIDDINSINDALHEFGKPALGAVE